MFMFPTLAENLLSLIVGCVTVIPGNKIELFCSSPESLSQIDYSPNFYGLNIIGTTAHPGILKRDALINLPNIKFLNVYYGVDGIEEDVFGVLKDLNSFYCEHCNLPVIKGSYFGNSNMTMLYLQKSNVQDIEPEAFSKLRFINYGFFPDNQISVIRRRAFENTNFNTLYLNSNKIELIEDGSFFGMTNLKYIDLSDNLLRKFNSNFVIGKSFIFENLQLSNNNLTQLSNDVINGLYNLKHFNVSGNNIEKVECSFYDFKHLYSLDLSQNKIMEINPDLFTENNNLTHLFLYGNKLKCINELLLKLPNVNITYVENK